MRLRAKDTVHISSVQSENLVEGDEFDLNDDEGKKLIDRGIAEQVRVKTPASEKDPAPAKAAPTGAKRNKGTVAAERKG